METIFRSTWTMRSKVDQHGVVRLVRLDEEEEGEEGLVKVAMARRYVCESLKISRTAGLEDPTDRLTVDASACSRLEVLARRWL